MDDAALSVNEALYDFDLIKFYQNFLNLMGDVQQSNGAIPNLVPNGGGYPADPHWGTALPTITWQLYRHYGDQQLLADYYGRVRAYAENVRSRYNNKALINLACQFGDWVPPPAYPMTNQHLIASFAFLHDVSLLINMSQVLGKTTDTPAYSTFYQQLADEFHRAFFNLSMNFYAEGMQAAQVLALVLPNVVLRSSRALVLDHLINDIAAKGNHVTTGIVSTAHRTVTCLPVRMRMPRPSGNCETLRWKGPVLTYGTILCTVVLERGSIRIWVASNTPQG